MFTRKKVAPAGTQKLALPPPAGGPQAKGLTANGTAVLPLASLNSQVDPTTHSAPLGARVEPSVLARWPAQSAAPDDDPDATVIGRARRQQLAEAQAPTVCLPRSDDPDATAVLPVLR